MEFVVWIYQPLEQAQIDQLLSPALDLSVSFEGDGKSKTPRQPLSGKKAEAVFYGTMLTRVHPVLEYKRIRRKKFLREPILSGMDDVYLGSGTHSWNEEEYEDLGISMLHIKGRLYYADNESYDSLKMLQWAAEEADDKGSGFRTVAFASIWNQTNTDKKSTNVRKLVLPKAFVVRYEEGYTDKDGMGAFEAVFQQSVTELTDCDKQIYGAAEISPADGDRDDMEKKMAEESKKKEEIRKEEERKKQEEGKKQEEEQSRKEEETTQEEKQEEQEEQETKTAKNAAAATAADDQAAAPAAGG